MSRREILLRSVVGLIQNSGLQILNYLRVFNNNSRMSFDDNKDEM